MCAIGADGSIWDCLFYDEVHPAIVCIVYLWLVLSVFGSIINLAGTHNRFRPEASRRRTRKLRQGTPMCSVFCLVH